MNPEPIAKLQHGGTALGNVQIIRRDSGNQGCGREGECTARPLTLCVLELRSIEELFAQLAFGLEPVFGGRTALEPASLGNEVSADADLLVSRTSGFHGRRR